MLIYCSGDQIKKNEMGGAFNTYGREHRYIQGFGGKPKGKRQLGRPRRRWKYNMTMVLQEVG